MVIHDKAFSVRLPRPLYNIVKEIAETEGVSVCKFLRKHLEDASLKAVRVKCAICFLEKYPMSEMIQSAWMIDDKHIFFPAEKDVNFCFIVCPDCYNSAISFYREKFDEEEKEKDELSDEEGEKYLIGALLSQINKPLKNIRLLYKLSIVFPQRYFLQDGMFFDKSANREQMGKDFLELNELGMGE